MKEIKTLIPDIQVLLKTKGWLDERLSQALSSDIASRLSEQYGENTRTPALRLSQMGPRCPRALWYSIHEPGLAEPLPPWAEVKYSFGHIIEGLAIAMAKAAGHEVVGEQDELVLDGILGHRDCVIDGAIVDVKSAASKSFDRFRAGTFNDPFGYLDQLNGYVMASADDPLVRVKDKGYLFVIDKQLGKMTLYEHEVTEDARAKLKARIGRYKRYIAQAEPPPCECGTVSEGAGGNIKLDLRASYSAFKHVCFPHLRTFLYAGGPVHLTRVNKRPYNKDGPIPEVDKYGNYRYN